MADMCGITRMTATISTNNYLYMLELFTYPFMQRAFLAGFVIAVLLGWLGVYTIARKMSFVGDGVAHASLAAVAMAILFGWSPLPVALIASVFIAAAIHLLGRSKNISQDTAIGVIFVAGMALGIVLLQFYEGYVPELVSYLFGNMLAIRSGDVSTIFLVGAAIFATLVAYRRQFVFLTIDPEGAVLHGINRNLLDLLLTILIAVTVVLSIKIVGIVLVSGLLILPSTVGKMLATSFKEFEIYSIVASLLFVFTGLVLSFYFDLPSGATIVLVGVFALLVTGARNALVFKK